MLDILFIAFLGEREPDELLPEDEAERERLLQDTNTVTSMLAYSLNGQDIAHTITPSNKIMLIAMLAKIAM